MKKKYWIKIFNKPVYKIFKFNKLKKNKKGNLKEIFVQKENNGSGSQHPPILHKGEKRNRYYHLNKKRLMGKC